MIALNASLPSSPTYRASARSRTLPPTPTSNVRVKSASSAFPTPTLTSLPKSFSTLLSTTLAANRPTQSLLPLIPNPNLNSPIDASASPTLVPPSQLRHLRTVPRLKALRHLRPAIPQPAPTVVFPCQRLSATLPPMVVSYSSPRFVPSSRTESVGDSVAGASVRR